MIFLIYRLNWQFPLILRSLLAMPFPMVHRLILFVSLFLSGASLHAQGFLANRSSLYAFTGTSGANLSQFNTLLTERGQLPIPNRYNSFGLGYQARLNDFIFKFSCDFSSIRNLQDGIKLSIAQISNEKITQAVLA